MRSIVAVLPGARAGRRLLELLVARAERDRVWLVPPRIATPVSLPELLIRGPVPCAEAPTRALAWVAALHATPSERLETFAGGLPAADDWLGWLLLGEVLDRLHAELAGSELDFAEVGRRALELPDAVDTERWSAMAEVQREYLRALHANGVEDAHYQRAATLAGGDAWESDRHIVLIGVVDMPAVARKMLAARPGRSTALIAAPDELSARFDDDGCLRASTWSDAAIGLRDDQIVCAARPIDQTAAVMRALASCAPKYSIADVTVALCDERLGPQLALSAERAGTPMRRAAGTRIEESAPYRLLDAVASHLASERIAPLAALVRHPDLERWLRARDTPLRDADWLSALDRTVAEHLASEIPERWQGEAAESALLETLSSSVAELVGALRGPARALRGWSGAVLAILAEVFGGEPLDPEVPRERVILGACDAIAAALDAQQSIPSALEPLLNGSDALRFTLHQLAGATIPAAAGHSAIEVLGWLEMPLEDSPCAIVVGFNEGAVPESLNADQFLPNSLRHHLGLVDNQQRYARDAYALSVLLATRVDATFIAGRVTHDNDPLAPSRLLLACEPDRVAERIARFYSTHEPPAHAASDSPGVSATQLTVPRPAPLAEPLRSLGVSWFHDYLACPYRFYLKRVLRLRRLDDAATELEPSQFGSLAHEALRDFGTGPLAGTADASAIASYLGSRLDALAVERFGPHATPAARVQIEQLRARLRGFARWQADRTRAGWRIAAVEWELDRDHAALTVDGIPMPVRGRVDRIDVNPTTREWAIIDYKTSHTSRLPDVVHRTDGAWRDLQLPLYRHLVPRSRELISRLGVDVGVPAVGYLCIPGDPAQVAMHVAPWTDDEHADALDTASAVIRSVRAEKFWPPVQPAPPFSEEFAAICQDGQLGAMDDGDESEPVEND